MPRRCPCGTGLTYEECCGRLHAGAPAPTAEALMRSRYSAFAVGDPSYLLATWHPRTRPDELELDEQTRWTGLEILGVEGGGLLAAEGVVEFRASYRRDGEPGAQQERSRFTKVEGRWVYLDGVTTA
jgi:SEC-C motif domain protein